MTSTVHLNKDICLDVERGAFAYAACMLSFSHTLLLSHFPSTEFLVFCSLSQMLPFVTQREREKESNMKIKSNQIIYYASYSYANDKKFNLVLIVPHACVYAYISSSSATVTTRHQYYCHCSFRSLNVQSKQAVERASKTSIAIRKRWKWQRSLTTPKEAGERKKATLALTHTSFEFMWIWEQIYRMHYTTFYSHSLVCQHNSKYRHSRHSFIHSNISFCLALSSPLFPWCLP